MIESRVAKLWFKDVEALEEKFKSDSNKIRGLDTRSMGVDIVNTILTLPNEWVKLPCGEETGGVLHD